MLPLDQLIQFFNIFSRRANGLETGEMGLIVSKRGMGSPSLSDGIAINTLSDRDNWLSFPCYTQENTHKPLFPSGRYRINPTVPIT